MASLGVDVGLEENQNGRRSFLAALGEAAEALGKHAGKLHGDPSSLSPFLTHSCAPHERWAGAGGIWRHQCRVIPLHLEGNLPDVLSAFSLRRKPEFLQL